MTVLVESNMKNFDTLLKDVTIAIVEAQAAVNKAADELHEAAKELKKNN